MIEKMTKYSFILLSGDKELFLKQLQDLGVVDITRSGKPVDEHSGALLARAESIRKAISIAQAAEEYPGPSKTASESTRTVSDPSEEVFNAVSGLEKAESRLASLRKEAEARAVWGNFDLEALKGLETNGCKVRFYCVPAKKFSAEWANLHALAEISRTSSNVYFVTVSNDPGYEFPVEECAAPEGTHEDCMKEIADTEARIAGYKAALTDLKASIPAMEKEMEGNLADLHRYLASVASESAVEERLSLFTGFAPVQTDGTLPAELDKLDIFYLKEESKAEDNPPIRLRNNKFNSMFEMLTDMYGRPAYDEFDPTPFIAIFFLLFFALCMGDAGYGLVLLAGGFALKKVRSFAKMAPLVITLGAGTFAIGILLHTFFSMDMAAWGWLPDWFKAIMLPAKLGDFKGIDIPESLAWYDTNMALSIVIGILHICVALIVKTWNTTRKNGFLHSLGTWGWTLLIVGGVAVGGIAFAGIIGETVTKWTIIVLGAVSALGIFLFNDIDRNPLKNIGSGIWDTYNTATGLLGDVLSYLRLYALGLAGGMLGMAFNTLGKMVLGDGSFFLNWIFCIILVVLGHVLNIAMAALGAFVHPLRLNFLEFFKNAGYQGSGRNYSPLSNNNNQ